MSTVAITLLLLQPHSNNGIEYVVDNAFREVGNVICYPLQTEVASRNAAFNAPVPLVCSPNLAASSICLALNE